MTSVSNRLDTLAGHILVLLAVVAVTLYGDYRVDKQDARVEQIAAEAHDSLCAFKKDLEARYAESSRIITAIVSGERPPIPGLEIAELQRSLENQQRTLDALQKLDCAL